MVQLPRGKSSIHDQVLACYIARGIRSQKQKWSNEVFVARHAFQGHPLAELSLELLILSAEDSTGDQRVDPDPLLSKVGGEVASQARDRGLGGSVHGRLEERRIDGEMAVEPLVGRNRPVKRANVDDRRPARPPERR